MFERRYTCSNHHFRYPCFFCGVCILCCLWRYLPANPYVPMSDPKEVTFLWQVSWSGSLVLLKDQGGREVDVYRCCWWKKSQRITQHVSIPQILSKRRCCIYLDIYIIYVRFLGSYISPKVKFYHKSKEYSDTETWDSPCLEEKVIYVHPWKLIWNLQFTKIEKKKHLQNLHF